MRAEAFRRFQEPAAPGYATEFSTAPDLPDAIHELSLVLSRLAESQELLVEEVREVASRPEPPPPPPPPESPPEEDGGPTATYDWAPTPPPSTPW